MKRALFAMLLLALALAPLAAETVLERPEIKISFDDDASTLMISVEWKAEDGSPRREVYSWGKDAHVILTQANGAWEKSDREFSSKNWEAYLLPDASGFLLMHRLYDGHGFSNLGLQLYQFFPQRQVRDLALAEGSPYWSPDGAQLALIARSPDANTVSLYRVADAALSLSRTAVSDAALAGDYAAYRRARICDDALPCDSGLGLSAPNEGKP